MYKWVSNDGWHFIEVDGVVYIRREDMLKELEEMKNMLKEGENK
jgi:hypothetical protein